METTAYPLAVTFCVVGISATSYLFGKLTNPKNKRLEQIEKTTRILLQDPTILKKYKEISTLTVKGNR